MFPTINFDDIPPGAAKLFARYLQGNVLDIGCGRGSIGLYHPKPVFGIDMDFTSLCQARLREHVCRGHLDSKKLPFGNNSFDSVFAKDILEHVQEPWVLLSEVRRVLKPGGIIIATSPMAKPEVVWNDYTHVRGFTKGAFTRLFRHTGFEILDIYPIGMYTVSSRYGFSHLLPRIFKLPGMGRLAVSWFIFARNP